MINLSKPCSLPNAPTMPLLGRSEIFACMAARAIIVVGACALIVGGVAFGLERYRVQTEIRQLKSADDIDRLRLERDAMNLQVAVDQQAISHANYRLANSVVLHRLFSIEIPTNHSYRLDKATIEPVPSAPGQIPGFRAELSWLVTKAAPINVLPSLTEDIVSSWKADFAANGPVNPWSIVITAPTVAPTLNTATETASYVIAATIRPPAQGLYSLQPNRSAKEALTAVQAFYAR